MAGQYYWVVVHLGTNDVLSGPFLSAQEANTEGFRANCPFDLFNYPTRDRAKATQMYKRERFTQGVGLAESLEKVKHQIPNERDEIRR